MSRLVHYFYLGKSINQLIKGNYTDDVTLLGTGVGTGILGIDVLADIRDVSADLTNWEWSWGHAGQTILDVVGIVPLIGAVKYTDEAGSLLKPVFKYGDELAIAGGGTIKQTDEVAEHITSITKENILDQVDDISKSARTTTIPDKAKDIAKRLINLEEKLAVEVIK